MILIVYILFFIAYFVVSILLVKAARKLAGNNPSRKRIAGAVVGCVMFLLIFWDWIPVLVEHKHLCETQAGFWEYKTPEEWIKENPETVGEDWGSNKWGKLHKSDKLSEGVQRYWTSSQVYWDVWEDQYFAHAIDRSEIKLVDAKSGALLAHYIEFNRGGWLGSGEVAPYKFWLAAGNRFCGDNRDFGYGRDFWDYVGKLTELGKGK